MTGDRSLKDAVFRVIEEPPEQYWPARFFNYFMILLIVANVLAVIFETVEPIRVQYSSWFLVIDVVSIALFTIEYFLRLWVCTLHREFRDPVTGRIRFALTPLALVDLFAFLHFYIPFLIPVDLRFIRILRLFRLVRVLKLGRYSEAMKIFNRVVNKTKEQMLLALSILFIVLIIVSTLMYYAERDVQPVKFGSIPLAMWWAVVTLATVGYGDVYPITTFGKIIGGAAVVTGIAIFALPTAILSAGFIEEIEERKVIVCPECGHRMGAEEKPDDDDPDPGPQLAGPG
jgi:voltage-gated potassium channel